MTTQTEAGPMTDPASSSPQDDLGLDRAFLLQLAQVPFLAVGWVVASALSTALWASAAPETVNYGPIVVVCIGMVIAAVIDGWAFKVPNWLTLSLIVSGWLLGASHDLSLGLDSGQGGIGPALLGTAVGFALLFPLLAIVGMGQGDVKMLMGFGSWVCAYFGGRDGVVILFWAFALGAVIGGLCGLVMMVLRRKFKKNLANFREIAIDLKILATVGPSAAAARSSARRPGWDRLPYGIPLCVGFLGYLAYRYLDGSLPGHP